MIAFNRTASIAPGKTASALAFAHQIAAYMKDAYGVELEVLVPLGGNPQRVAWSTHYKDLAAFDAVSTKLPGDAKYWEIVNQGTANFLPGTIRDAMWRIL